MSAPLDELYLTWLYRQIGNARLKNPARTYWGLSRHLYRKEFIWLIPNDDNRLEDGKELRYLFILDQEISDVDEEWYDLPCSCLEMLIALSRRLAFEAEGEPSVWFWHFIALLDLYQYNDKEYDDLARDLIEEALDRVMWRQYEPDGHGGLFPLSRPQEDQREVELWYQMSAYLLELP